MEVVHRPQSDAIFHLDRALDIDIVVYIGRLLAIFVTLDVIEESRGALQALLAIVGARRDIVFSLATILQALHVPSKPIGLGCLLGGARRSCRH